MKSEYFYTAKKQTAQLLWLGRQDSICRPCDEDLQITVLRISPVAVPYIFGGGQGRLENIDRCHSLGSLLPPPAALPSLPQRATLVDLITRRAAAKHAAMTKKKTPSIRMRFLFGCGGRTRTYDLRVMSKRAPRVFAFLISIIAYFSLFQFLLKLFTICNTLKMWCAGVSVAL